LTASGLETKYRRSPAMEPSAQLWTLHLELTRGTAGLGNASSSTAQHLCWSSWYKM